MELFSIIFFLIIMYGFGSFASFIAKESEDFLERHLMRFGIGLGTLLFFGFLLNFARIPLDWRIFLLTAILILAARAAADYRKKEIFNVKFNFNLYALLMLALFAVTLFMYTKGAFAYPYLEDDDSWSHAVGVKFVSMEKTAFAGKNSVFHYIDPYPPAYDLLLGIIHQTNDSVYWTLKFFNALIISLSIIFFYYFAKTFTKSSKKAFYSAFALFAVPAFMSHFIWAISMTMPLFFVAFYCAEKISDDKKWWILAALVIMPTITSSPTHSTYFGLFYLIYFIGKTIVERRALIYEFLAGLAGAAMAFVLWWLPVILEHGLGAVISSFVPKAGRGGFLNIHGTGDRTYGLSDFLCQPGTPCYDGQNMINNPIGIGVVLSILAIIGLAYALSRYNELLSKDNCHVFTSLLWFLLAFYAVNAAKMPIKISPFRAWMILAIPVALLAAEAISLIAGLAKSAALHLAKLNRAIASISAFIVLALLFYGIFATSFIPKYRVNTSSGWSIGGFWAAPSEEISGYLWMKQNLPPNSRVFTFSNNGVVIGFDNFVCHWCPEVRKFQQEGINKTPDEIRSWLNKNDYGYVVVDAQAAKKFGAEATNSLLSKLANASMQPVVRNNGFALFRV